MPPPTSTTFPALALPLLALLLMTGQMIDQAHAIKVVTSTAHDFDPTCALGSTGVSQILPVRPDGVCKTLHRFGTTYDSMWVDCASNTFRYYPGVPECQGSVPTRVIGSCVDMSSYASLACRDVDPSEIVYGTAREGAGCNGAVDRDLVFQIGACITVGDAYAIFNVSNGVFVENRYSTFPCSGYPVNTTSGALGTCYYNSKYNVSVNYQVGSPFPVPSPLTVKAVVLSYYGNNDATCTGARDYSTLTNFKPDGSCSKHNMNGGVSSVRVDCAAGTYAIYENTATCSGAPTISTNLGSCANFHPYGRVTCEDVDPATIIYGDVGPGLTCAQPDTTLIYQTGRCSSVGTALAIFQRGPTSDSWTQTTYASYPCVTPVNTTSGKFGVCYPAPAYNVSITFRNSSTVLGAGTPTPSGAAARGVAAGSVLLAAALAAASAVF